MTPFRKLFVLPLFCAMLAVPVGAHAATVEEARGFVDRFADAALTVIKDKKLGKDAKQRKLEKLFGTAVDIPWVGRFVLGRYWRQATPAQREKYIKEYSGFITTTYAGRFATYSGGGYKILESREDEEPGEYRVSMEIITAENKKVLVDYRVREGDDKKLRFFDVVVEGVSMIATQRSEFASVLGNKGLDYLIEQLENRSLETSTAKSDS